MKKFLIALLTLCVTALPAYAKFPGQPPAGPSAGIPSSVYDTDADGLIDPDAGGTELDTSASTGVVSIDNGTWSVTNWGTADYCLKMNGTGDGLAWGVCGSGGSGDMLKSVYDTDLDNIVDNAEAGDSATSFFSSGSIEHERGGLEADVSSYDGLVKISSGSTSAVTVTSAGEALIDDADAAAQRTTLGLGSISTQSSSNVSITGGSVSGLSSLGVSGTSSLSAVNASDNVTVADDKYFRLGTDGDYITYFKSSTGQQIFSTAIDGSGMTDANPAWYFDFAVGGTADSGQRLFGWGVNGTPVCYSDEAGNLNCTGTGTFASLATTCSPAANTCGYNGANTGWPVSTAEGQEGYNMTLDEKGVYDDSAGIASYRYGHNDAICFVIDGGGSAISTGQKGHLEIPFNAWITQATTLADQSGSIVVDIWKDTYANFPPVDGDSITASAPPTLSSSQKAQDSTLTGWTKTITAGDILAYNVDSATTVTRVTVCLKVKK